MEKQEGKKQNKIKENKTQQLPFRRAKGNNTEKEHLGFLFYFIVCVN